MQFTSPFPCKLFSCNPHTICDNIFPISFTIISPSLHIRHHMVIEIVSPSGISSSMILGLLPKLAMVGSFMNLLNKTYFLQSLSPGESLHLSGETGSGLVLDYLCISFCSLSGKIERKAMGWKTGKTWQNGWQIKIQDCFPPVKKRFWLIKMWSMITLFKYRIE